MPDKVGDVAFPAFGALHGGATDASLYKLVRYAIFNRDDMYHNGLT